jgi:hypothetical protein
MTRRRWWVHIVARNLVSRVWCVCVCVGVGVGVCGCGCGCVCVCCVRVCVCVRVFARKVNVVCSCVNTQIALEVAVRVLVYPRLQCAQCCTRMIDTPHDKP